MFQSIYICWACCWNVFSNC